VRHIVPLIWEAVAASVSTGVRIDVDELCREFFDQFPHFELGQIKNVVLAAIEAHGGTPSE